jgi:hypothetical protein
MTELELASQYTGYTSQVIEISKEKEMQIRLLNTEKQLQESIIKEQEARSGVKDCFGLFWWGLYFSCFSLLF